MHIEMQVCLLHLFIVDMHLTHPRSSFIYHIYVLYMAKLLKLKLVKYHSSAFPIKLSSPKKNPPVCRKTTILWPFFFGGPGNLQNIKGRDKHQPGYLTVSVLTFVSVLFLALPVGIIGHECLGVVFFGFLF